MRMGADAAVSLVVFLLLGLYLQVKLWLTHNSGTCCYYYILLKIEIQFHCLSMKFRYHRFIWQSNCRECDITWQLIKPKTNMSKIYENFFGDLFVCPRITFLFITKQKSIGLLFSTSENTVYVGIKSNFAKFWVSFFGHECTFLYFHIFIFSYSD